MNEMNEKLRALVAAKDAARGRPLAPAEQLANLRAALSDHDTDCATHNNAGCDCGANDFRAKFGHG